jgi:hypothetical protein
MTYHLRKVLREMAIAMIMLITFALSIARADDDQIYANVDPQFGYQLGYPKDWHVNTDYFGVVVFASPDHSGELHSNYEAYPGACKEKKTVTRSFDEFQKLCPQEILREKSLTISINGRPWFLDGWECNANDREIQNAAFEEADSLCFNLQMRSSKGQANILKRSLQSWRRISKLDQILQYAAYITTLEITGKDMATFSRSIEKFASLDELGIHCLEGIPSFPEDIGKIHRLKVLRLDNGNGCAGSPSLPVTLGQLKELRTLELSGLSDPDKLVKLNLTFIDKLTELKTLRLDRIGQSDIPQEVFQLKLLEQFSFTGNKLSRVPTWIVSLKNLQQLDLSSNELQDIPNELNMLPRLTEIDLGNNCDIEKSTDKQAAIRKRFPKIKFNFVGEYDCPS